MEGELTQEEIQKILEVIKNNEKWNDSTKGNTIEDRMEIIQNGESFWIADNKKTIKLLFEKKIFKDGNVYYDANQQLAGNWVMFESRFKPSFEDALEKFSQMLDSCPY